jgi:hypothetical protein
VLSIISFFSLKYLVSDSFGMFEAELWQLTKSRNYFCWNLVHVAHLVNSKACTIIVPYCQDKKRLSCLNIGVSYHSKIDACERKADC